MLLKKKESKSTLSGFISKRDEVYFNFDEQFIPNLSTISNWM